jgi:hypothetical protein
MLTDHDEVRKIPISFEEPPTPDKHAKVAI